MATKKNIQSACLIIIGNEILSGRTQDKNINHIAKELFLCGVSLQLVIVIPDSKKIIISQIRKLKTKYDYIITTGGIGPTHDDITSESISLAVRKKYWLLPIIIVLALFGILIVLSQGSAVAPFIYTIF